MQQKRELRVLIVDENDQLLSEIQHFVEALASNTAIVTRLVGDLVDAEREMDSWSPTVVLLDAHLPRMDTFDYLEHHLSPMVPVIMMSAHLSSEIKKSALAKGAISYFHKSGNPDDVEDLMQAIFLLSEESSDKH